MAHMVNIPYLAIFCSHKNCLKLITAHEVFERGLIILDFFFFFIYNLNRK